MKIVVVRHGETEENAKHILMGQRPGTLSRKGRAQAERLAQRLKSMNIDAIFSSDLRRARETTRKIARYHKVPIFYTKSLREQNYGVFQGRPLEEFLEPQKRRGTGGPDARPKEGESLADVKSRVHRFVKGISTAYEGKTVVISAHAGVVYSLFSIYGHVPLGKVIKMEPKNAGILVILVASNKSTILKDGMFK